MISKLKVLFWILLTPALLLIAAIEIFKSISDTVVMPELPTAMPELPTVMPELPTAMPELPTAMPELPTAMPELPAAVPAAVFILAVAMSVALPVFLRALFAEGLRGRESTTAADYYLYQLRLLVCVCSTPYLAAAASLLMFPEFFHAGIVLAALYGCYFQYPSHKKIEAEKRLYRVRM